MEGLSAVGLVSLFLSALCDASCAVALCCLLSGGEQTTGNGQRALVAGSG